VPEPPRTAATEAVRSPVMTRPGAAG